MRLHICTLKYNLKYIGSNHGFVCFSGKSLEQGQCAQYKDTLCRDNTKLK